jgi:aminopeptidase N
MRNCFLLLLVLCCANCTINGQTTSKADTLRGSINANRSWWDLTYYDLFVSTNIEQETIEGSNAIYFKVVGTGKTMQIDLQQPLEITRVLFNNKELSYTRDGNIYLIQFPTALKIGSMQNISIYYKGKPRKAIRAPWDGGIVWEKDAKNRPFVNTACQGLGASVWWPCKDHQSDEPDSMQTTYVVPRNLVAVGNGRLRDVISDQKGTKAYVWFVKNPINNYGITMNIGNYVNFTDTVKGEKGILDMSYWVLDYSLAKAKKQFVQAKQTIKAFEYWFGPYPFYEDSYKLVETHHLGMEHQSAVAYGNKFMNGYLGSDLSGSGWGKKWDYIIVHESGHEWFGNNVTTNDIADMWIHEGFTDYSETLFTEYYYGKEAANEYCRGLRFNIQNDAPIIGPYGVNQEGSGDMYAKGANIIHSLRQLINDDEKFRKILRGIQKTFYHKTTNSKDVENYISKESGIDFSKFFDQYLRTTQIPVLEYSIEKKEALWTYKMQFKNCITGFAMHFPLRAKPKKGTPSMPVLPEALYITDNKMETFEVNANTKIEEFLNPNIYIRLKEVK